MRNADVIMKEAVERLLFESNVKRSIISEATGIGQNVLGNYANGKSNVNNMTFSNMSKLYKYQMKIEEEKEMKVSREESFGRALGVLDVISARHFEKGKPHAATKFLQDFSRKPMKWYAEAFKDVTKYADLFSDVDLALMNRVNKYIAQMDPDDFNDEPLGPSYLIFVSKEATEIHDLIKSKGEL